MSRHRHHSSDTSSKRHKSHHSTYDYERSTKYSRDKSRENSLSKDKDKEKDREKDREKDKEKDKNHRSYSSKSSHETEIHIKDDEREKERMRIKQEKIQQFLRQRAARAATEASATSTASKNTSSEKLSEKEPVVSLTSTVNTHGSVSGFEFGRATTKISSQNIMLDDEEKTRKTLAESLGDEKNATEEVQSESIHTTDQEEADPLDLFMQGMDELSEMTEQEVNDYRLELDGIKIRGLGCPKPVQNWSHCGLPSHVLDIIYHLNYQKPTAIQAQAIPAIMSGRDVIGVAKTGSGKTIAFLLPMFRHIKDQRPIDSLEGPIALIMTPTRELAVQIHKECKHFLKVLGLRAVCAYGGSPIKDQIAELKKGAEIVVCTPGRIIDLLGANQGRVTNLRRTSFIVLDEADRMFDLGFEPQVMKVVNNVRPDRQTVLFSATFPKQMDALSRKILQKPIEITVGARSVVAPEIQQIVEICSEDNKFVRLLELLGNLYVNDDDVRTLVFVDRQEAADSLLRDLMRRGYPCMSIHGGKDQFDRDSTIADFKAGVFPILIATSVAARGLDIKQLKLVVNYDCPNHLEDYVHRVGRTGRAGETGTAVTFITPEQDRYAADIVRALRISKAYIPDDVQKLADEFIKKVKSGQEKASGSGFGGKGLDRLDKDRDLARKLQRRAYGEESDEDIDIFDDDYEYSKMDSTDAKEQSYTSLRPGVSSNDSNAASTSQTSKAKGNITDDILERVRKAAGSVTSRLQGHLRSGITIESGGADSREYTATIEINDFPQKARWAVTNRTNIARIIESTGTSITNKGNWYPPGKPVPPGETKLYILIEGETQISVDRALHELKRLLTEGTVSALESEIRSGVTGRYSVL
ncbi:hypothetical protein PORY_001814 [Pneumocystis oryctolagi]|uniref:Uncharacterized protein n=1 Tax=Pneumocystis oryctolagi TaxID=42067 RepID=A0ACB7CAX9_9ASCO|nr:hypothetical protein PORY_001814 [Pneumocystis oryctolagi]